jgi:hypothetical protein
MDGERQLYDQLSCNRVSVLGKEESGRWKYVHRLRLILEDCWVWLTGARLLVLVKDRRASVIRQELDDICEDFRKALQY